MSTNDQSSIVICGTGAACERDCPVMRMGRVCPSIAQFRAEVRALDLAA